MSVVGLICKTSWGGFEKKYGHCNTLLKPKHHSLRCHGFMVHAFLLRMHTNVVYFRCYAKTVPSRMKLTMCEPTSMTTDTWSRRVTLTAYMKRYFMMAKYFFPFNAIIQCWTDWNLELSSKSVCTDAFNKQWKQKKIWDTFVFLISKQKHFEL